jgi:hypothetical protein
MELNSLLEARTQNITRAVVLNIGGEECPAVIRPAGISPKTQMGLALMQRIDGDPSEQQAEHATHTLLTFLSEVIVSWELTAGGVPVDPSVEGLEVIPFDLLGVLVQAVQEAMVTVPKATPASSGKSTATAAKRRKT